MLVKKIEKNVLTKTVHYFLFVIMILQFFASGVHAQNTSNQIPVSDLDFLYKTLIQKHPKLFITKHRKEFDAAYKSTRENFDQLSRTKALMEMMRLIATINDGHTSIARIWDEKTNFRRLPLRIYWFSDGFFISRIDEKYSKYAGMKVLKIGNQPMEKVIELATPFIHGENSMKLKDVLPNRITIFEFLEGLELVNKSKSVSLTLLDKAGKKHILKISPMKKDEKITWISARKNNTKPPLYLSKSNVNYWYTYLKSKKTLYFQFNVVSEIKGQPFKDFVEKMFQEIDSLPVEKMVIDIRNNNGGDNTILKPLIHKLIQNKKINKKGRLFTVIGRLTFSAAVNLVTELEKHTETIFVGEPTAAAPNHFGETQLIRLPISKVAVLYSSQFWQGSMPWDKREWIEPSIKIELSSDDYKNGHDPILKKILELK